MNYWPVAKAMYWWKNFDRDEVRRDFERMREFGIDVARFFLLWEDFQPRPDAIQESALENLRTVLDAGTEAGVKAMPTLFVGHMSGVNWIPAWALEATGVRATGDRIIAQGREMPQPIRRLFADPLMLEAGARLVRAVASAIAGHAALHSIDLGNEPSICYAASNAQEVTDWTRMLGGIIREESPGTGVLLGTHQTDIARETFYRIERIAPFVDLSCMHAYVDYAGGPDGKLDSVYAAYTSIMTRRIGGKGILMQEFGCPVVTASVKREFASQFPLVEESVAARFYEETLEGIHRSGAVGAMPWCWQDYAEDLWTVPPCDTKIHERFFGMLRPDGTSKPHADVIRSFAHSKPKILPVPPLLTDISSSHVPDEATYWRRYASFREEWKTLAY